VLVLSSNVVGVGEEPVSLPDWWGADLQVFSVLMVRDALWGIKPPAKTSQSWLYCRLQATRRWFLDQNFGMADTSPSVGFSSRACDLWVRPAVVLD
jgi:hypothetical protein